MVRPVHCPASASSTDAGRDATPTVTTPPTPVAINAFVNRFTRTWWIFSASAHAMGSDGPSST